MNYHPKLSRIVDDFDNPEWLDKNFDMQFDDDFCDEEDDEYGLADYDTPVFMDDDLDDDTDPLDTTSPDIDIDIDGEPDAIVDDLVVDGLADLPEDDLDD
jgi:hypothetical protein